MSLYNKTASALADMLKNKEISSVEITKDVLERINACEDKVGAYVTVSEETALEQAKQADELIASGNATAITGIPMGIKDNICTKGVKTTCSSKMLGNFVPPYNATVMDKLNSAGAVTLGKLNMDEFAMGSSCENSYFKKTANPHDLTKVPGGSSGGSAAAVAAGEAILTLGSDTGGSIRQPAAYCGVVGLKPTYGTVSRYGLVAFASSLDQIGPMGRSVDDVAMLYNIICGQDNKDATTVNCDFNLNYNGSVKGLKIGIPEEYFGKGISKEVSDSVMNAIETLKSLGAETVSIKLPSTPHALSAYYVISSAEASSNLARFDGVKYGYRTEEYTDLIDMYEKTRSEGFGDEVKRRIYLGTFVLSSGYYDAFYKRAKLMQNIISKEFDDAFTKCDVLITPTTPTPAFGLGERINDPLLMYANDVCTVPINIAGLPAISTRCGTSKSGLPIGMQIIGKKYSENTLFNVAKAYENVNGICPIANI